MISMYRILGRRVLQIPYNVLFFSKFTICKCQGPETCLRILINVTLRFGQTSCSIILGEPFSVLSLSLSWTTRALGYRRRRTPESQVFVRPFSGQEHTDREPLQPNDGGIQKPCTQDQEPGGGWGTVCLRARGLLLHHESGGRHGRAAGGD